MNTRAGGSGSFARTFSMKANKGPSSAARCRSRHDDRFGETALEDEREASDPPDPATVLHQGDWREAAALDDQRMPEHTRCIDVAVPEHRRFDAVGHPGGVPLDYRIVARAKRGV